MASSLRMIGTPLLLPLLPRQVPTSNPCPRLPPDIAVNLTDVIFKGIYNGKRHHVADLPAVLARAWSAGVDRIIVTGGSLEESKEALAIAEQTIGSLFCTVGVHPTRCKEFEESGDPEQHFQELFSLAKQGVEKGKVVAGIKGIADANQLSRVLYHNTCRVFSPHDLDTAAYSMLETGADVL